MSTITIELGANDAIEWDQDRARFLVPSRSEAGLAREVSVQGFSMTGRRVYLSFACTCPAHRMRRQQPAGMTSCSHEAKVAAWLEEQRLARYDRTTSRWIATSKLTKQDVGGAIVRAEMIEALFGVQELVGRLVDEDDTDDSDAWAARASELVAAATVFSTKARELAAASA